MKKIIIKRMRFLNFKGLRDVTVNFSDNITEISGANGTGKTSVFDGFTWLMFGKNSEDKKEFGIKTKDADGRAIERLPHEVSAVLSVDGEEITLCRRLVEKWQKKRGSAEETFAGNSEERLYNDVPCSVAEWNLKMDAICPEHVFKFITNPLYFPAQKPDKQREMLFKMAGGLTDEEVAAGNKAFSALLAQLTGKTMDEFKREITAKKRRIKAELDTLPERIDERKRDIGDEPDYAAIEQGIDALQKEAATIEARLTDITEAVKAKADEHSALLQAMFDAQAREREIKAKALNEANKEYFLMSRRRSDNKYEIERLTKRLESLDTDRKTVENKIRQLSIERDKLIAEWREIKSRTIEFKENDFTCPTCGRHYAMDEIERLQEEMTTKFNTCKAEDLQRNNEKGLLIKKQKEELQAQLESILSETTGLRTAVEELEEETAAITIPVPRDVHDILQGSAEYAEALQALEEAKKAVDGFTAESGDDGNEALHRRKKEIADEIAELQRRLSMRDVARRNRERIAELEIQMRSQASELARLDGLEFTMSEFSKAKTAMLEERVNKLFSFVRFKMSEQLINGAETETCTATVDGVPYADLNKAKKTNAGLDIINAICRHMELSAPIFIDNAESVNELLPTTSQQIRLRVTDKCGLSIN